MLPCYPGFWASDLAVSKTDFELDREGVVNWLLSLPIELLRALSHWAQMSLSQLREASDRREVVIIFFLNQIPNPIAVAILLEPGAKIRFLLAQISDKYVKV